MFYWQSCLMKEVPSGGGAWALCKVSDTCSCDHFLSEEEKREYCAFKSERRKREWLGARIALKKILLDNAVIQKPELCRIEKNRLGSPVIHIQEEGRSLYKTCSISHKDGMAAVCVSFSQDFRMGIDIEAVTDKPRRLKRYYLNPEDRIQSICNPEKKFTALWACKEAASKVRGMGLLMHIKDLVVKEESDGRVGIWEREKKVMKGFFCSLNNNSIIAICYGIDVDKCE